MRHWHVIALLALFHQTYTTVAAACGPTPTLIDALLPLENATDVPLDAALISSSNDGGALISLRLADTEKSDAGATTIALDTECHVAFQGAVCVARPSEALQPNTTYEWSVLSARQPNVDPSMGFGVDWRPFTTSSEFYSGTAPDIRVEVLTNGIYTNPPCGLGHSATLSFEIGDRQAPWVMNIADITPDYLTQAAVLTTTEPLNLVLYNPPDCVVPEVFTPTGQRIALDELCLEDELPVTMYDDMGQPIEDELDGNATANDAEADGTQSGKGDETTGSGLSKVDDQSAGSASCVVSRSNGSRHATWAALCFGTSLLVARRRRPRLSGTR